MHYDSCICIYINLKAHFRTLHFIIIFAICIITYGMDRPSYYYTVNPFVIPLNTLIMAFYDKEVRGFLMY